MKRGLSLLVLIALVFSLTGCGLLHQHEWKEASCTEPKTCARCGATEGQALGHDWKEASCTEPKTCARCGATEGDALGHDWTEATCTEPKTCARCGATEGDALGHDPSEADYGMPSVCSRCGEEFAPALTPDFVKYGFDTFCEIGVSYEFHTFCYNDANADTVGNFTVTSYKTIPSDGYDLERKEGYEWKIVSFEVSFANSDAQFSFLWDDYYDTRLMNDTSGQDINEVFSWQVHWNGEIRECFMKKEYQKAVSQGVKTYTYTVCCQVPEGYDGVVIGVQKPLSGQTPGMVYHNYFFDYAGRGSLFFRLT